MLKQINKSIKILKKSSIFLKILILLAVIYVVYILFNKSNYKEGYSNLEHLDQDVFYLNKKNDDIYDQFYANMYDDLTYEEDRVDFEIKQIKKLGLLQDYSVVLDVGCGTGHHVNRISSLKTFKNITCVGIDKSKHMIQQCKRNYPKNKYQTKDILKTLSFEQNQFNLILCLHFTVYYTENKHLFFSNCAHWLMPSGYLVLHLVNKEKFNPLIPIGETKYLNPQKILNKRITKTTADIGDTKYTADFKLGEDNISYFKEKFTNYNTNKTREHELKLYMEDRETILKIAKINGFEISKIIDMKECGYDYQYLYVLRLH